MKVSKESLTPTLVPSDFFDSLAFWSELSAGEQKTLKTETLEFMDEMKTMRQSRTRAVVHLMKVRDLLLPKGHWVRYMQSLAHSSRSSYRWLNRANELELPAPVLEAAADRGIDLIHASYLNPLKQLPPPKTFADADPGDPKVGHYLDRVEALRGQEGPAATLLTSEDGEKRAWRAVIREWERVGSRGRSAWGLRLIGRLMHRMSLPAQRVEPEAPPADFKPVAGYPKGKPRK